MDYKQKEILQKFSTQNLQLSSINDLNAVKKEYMGTFSNLSDVRRLGVELKKKAQSSIDILNKIENKIKQELSSFEQKAKDLGVDVKNVKEYQDLVRVLNTDIPDYIRIYKKAMKVDTL